jgi:hypothetical protein
MAGGFGAGKGRSGPFHASLPPDFSDAKDDGGELWQWHITETFKGLIALAVETAKMLALINGGGAVAILAYLLLTAHTRRSRRQPFKIFAADCFQ